MNRCSFLFSTHNKCTRCPFLVHTVPSYSVHSIRETDTSYLAPRLFLTRELGIPSYLAPAVVSYVNNVHTVPYHVNNVTNVIRPTGQSGSASLVVTLCVDNLSAKWRRKGIHYSFTKYRQQNGVAKAYITVSQNIARRQALSQSHHSGVVFS